MRMTWNTLLKPELKNWHSSRPVLPYNIVSKNEIVRVQAAKKGREAPSPLLPKLSKPGSHFLFPAFFCFSIPRRISRAYLLKIHLNFVCFKLPKEQTSTPYCILQAHKRHLFMLEPPHTCYCLLYGILNKPCRIKDEVILIFERQFVASHNRI